MNRVHGVRVVRVIVKSSYFSNICTYENAQVAIKYCFQIVRNVYSSKKCDDSEFNSVSLKNHDGWTVWRGNIQ